MFISHLAKQNQQYGRRKAYIYIFMSYFLIFFFKWKEKINLVLISLSHKHPSTSVNAHHEPREVSSALHPEGADEEVEDSGDED